MPNICNIQCTNIVSNICNTSHVVTFDLGLLLQDQMRAAKLKGAYNCLIAHTFFECETNQKDIMAWALGSSHVV